MTAPKGTEEAEELPEITGSMEVREEDDALKERPRQEREEDAP